MMADRVCNRCNHSIPKGLGMDLYEVLDRVVELLRSRKRVTYRLLQRQFSLDAATLEDLKAELLFAHPQVQEEGDRGLVWPGVSPAVAPAGAPDPAHPHPPGAPAGGGDGPAGDGR
jgi:hypothetical protein